MHCPNCSNQTETDAVFCTNCGTLLNRQQSQMNTATAEQASCQQSAQQPTNQKNALNKGKIGGIIMLVIGLLSFFGSLSNGSFADYVSEGVDFANIVTILLQVGLVAGGIYLIIKNKK